MNSPQRYRFSKEEKLKSRKLIDQLFQEGKSISSFPLKVIFLKQNPYRHLQAGVTASGRSFKKAVDRNRIKRMMKEAYRLQKMDLELQLLQQQQQLSLFFIYTAKEMSPYSSIELACRNIIRKLIQSL